MTFYDPEKTLIADTECFPNLWSIGFKRVSDGKTLVMEHSARRTLNVDKLAAILSQNKIIGYNWQGYDIPMICKVLAGCNNAALKRANDQIILGGIKYWEAEEALGIRVPRNWDYIDLMEPQPNAFASLKTLQGRLHGKKMQDLPYHPDQVLTEAEMDEVLSYMGNDLDATENLFHAMIPALELRAALSSEYKTNFMCKSDSQIGEAIMRKRVEELTRQKVEKVATPTGTMFHYPVPAYLNFQTPQLAGILDRVRATEFIVKADGKVDLPGWLSSAKITIGDTAYAIGIGGLHSTEESRAVVNDEEYQLRDFDVASYYPAIIINSGLYPKALGRQFLDVFRKVRDERVVAKRRAQELGREIAELEGAAQDAAHLKEERRKQQTKAEGLKISSNGVFGKLGSRYSILYAPHLLIAVTLTGQLSLLMLIERAEQAGIAVVSANTDGVVFRVPRHREDELFAITKQWERDTGFELEDTEYDALYSQSVNTYIAIKPGGKAKRKGTLANPRAEGDMRGQLMKNPQMPVCSDAVVAYLTKSTPLAQTIRECRDIRDFVTVVNVKGGGVWVHEPNTQKMSLGDPYDAEMYENGVRKTYDKIVGLGDNCEYLGKVVRYIWSTNGSPIYYKTPHPTTGNFKKVSKSEGCRPMMELPDEGEWPVDLDYQRYIDAAEDILRDIGVFEKPMVIKPLRVFKHSAILYWAIAV